MVDILGRENAVLAIDVGWIRRDVLIGPLVEFERPTNGLDVVLDAIDLIASGDHFLNEQRLEILDSVRGENGPLGR